MLILTASIHHILNLNLQGYRVWYLTLNSDKCREGMSEVRGTQGGRNDDFEEVMQRTPGARNDDLKGAGKEVIDVRDNDPGEATIGAQEGEIDDRKKEKKEMERQWLLYERVEGRPLNQ